MAFKDGKMKAVTFSYDDGIYQDKRLVELLNRYQLKCTFNLNSGIQSEESNWEDHGIHIKRMEKDNLKELYQGHEIAVHGLTHASLVGLTEEQMNYEIDEDKKNLEQFFGQKMVGMAYAYGTYNDEVVDMLRRNGIQYARTVESTNNFELQSDLLRFKPTCHHNEKELFTLAERFLQMEPETPQIFYIWGHSYEFDVDNNWEIIEEFFKLISGRDDIYYGTNSEVLLAKH
ncbi:polysaccharide deacetylase family protein [Anaeromicropila herbilytica]|uniref:Polysaccharide deacetylase n=1 Tax=Anaeromicropila herbilytica TaxID=2785025 RepID=A0A7R7ID07_9FIRM|nr:polysaccharide deacetylase family protein [Anaeromicropila herbilytica]BCN30514.1 polysaccharide deacetylase [Anaeromicropila herbilytica]